jgi:hypothetical protein
MIVSSSSSNYQAQQNLPKKTNLQKDEIESSFDSENSYNIKTAGIHMTISKRALELYADYISKVEQPLARF